MKYIIERPTYYPYLASKSMHELLIWADTPIIFYSLSSARNMLKFLIEEKNEPDIKILPYII